MIYYPVAIMVYCIICKGSNSLQLTTLRMLWNSYRFFILSHLMDLGKTTGK